MQAPKNGFFYVLDRETGQLISAQPFVPVNWATRRRPGDGPADRESRGALRRDGQAVRFAARPGRRAQLAADELQPAHAPGLPARDGDVVPVRARCGAHHASARVEHRRGLRRGQPAAGRGGQGGHQVAPQGPSGRVGSRCSSARSGVCSTTTPGTAAWYRPPETSSSRARRWAISPPSARRPGEKLWSVATGTGILAPPVTYEAGGQQYVVIEVGWGGAFGLAAGELARDAHIATNTPRIFAFKLDGQAAMPAVGVAAAAQTRSAARRRDGRAGERRARRVITRIAAPATGTPP